MAAVPIWSGPGSEVRAATLLIVGSHDPEVIELNLAASVQLHCEHRLEVIRGASHLFEEPGTLELVAELARDWFIGHFSAQVTSPSAR